MLSLSVPSRAASCSSVMPTASTFFRSPAFDHLPLPSFFLGRIMSSRQLPVPFHVSRRFLPVSARSKTMMNALSE